MSAKRWIIGMGCDPNRANFAKKNLAPRLGVEMDFARNVETLLSMVKSKEYAVFFIAPGMCSLLGEEGGKKVAAKVKEIQPKIAFLMITDVSQTMAMLSKALGLNDTKDIAPMSEDWPFVD